MTALSTTCIEWSAISCRIWGLDSRAWCGRRIQRSPRNSIARSWEYRGHDALTVVVAVLVSINQNHKAWSTGIVDDLQLRWLWSSEQSVFFKRGLRVRKVGRSYMPELSHIAKRAQVSSITRHWFTDILSPLYSEDIHEEILISGEQTKWIRRLRPSSSTGHRSHFLWIRFKIYYDMLS